MIGGWKNLPTRQDVRIHLVPSSSPFINASSQARMPSSPDSASIDQRPSHPFVVVLPQRIITGREANVPWSTVRRSTTVTILHRCPSQTLHRRLWMPPPPRWSSIDQRPSHPSSSSGITKFRRPSTNNCVVTYQHRVNIIWFYSNLTLYM
jgi:hypothetical protein